MKQLALVTCLYDLVKRGHTSHRTVEWMLDNAAFVLAQDRELVIFTDPNLDLEARLRELRGDRLTKVVAVPFESLLRADRAAAVKRGALPLNANKAKDTPIYIQLTWSKFSMLEMALKVTRASHVGWIDLAITHVAKLPPENVDVFADPSDQPHVHVLRCFGKSDVDRSDYWRSVQGHLAAGLVAGSRECMRDLAADFWRAADLAASMGLSPHEEGLLSYVVGQRPGDFSYSYGDYEDILRNHDAPRGGDAHRTWIVSDAHSRGLPDMMGGPMRPMDVTLGAQRGTFMDIATPHHDAAASPPIAEAPSAKFSVFRPAFSPGSCYLLRDAAEEAYFARHGGAPEAQLIEWARQFIASDEIFVDVGAHVGTWSQHFALKCKQVHSFEPQRSTYERLYEGVRLAKLRNVTCHDVALGGQGEVDLHVVSVDGGGSTLRHRQELGAVLGVERVRCAQLDDFEFDNLGAIKIDAEGFEIDILRGAAKTLEKHRPTMLLEAWDHEWYARERAELIAHVVGLGYGVVPVQGWSQMLLVEPMRKKRSSASRSTDGNKISDTNDATIKVRDEKPVSSEAADLMRALQATASLTHDRPLLGLVMIVKNEAKRIATVLASYRPYIDAWTILDTGSTDGTQDLIKRDLAGIPGVLHEEAFVDFATSRNRALELHGTATVFSIMPNGDVLQGGAALVSFLDAHRRDLAGAYRVRIAPGHYYHPLVMRTGFGWRYKWRTHECAMGPNTGAAIPDVTVFRDRGTRTSDEWRTRWTRDLDLLNRDRVDDANDPRPYFYLGQTHECLGQPAQALEMYEQRAKMGGYFDEVYEAKFRIAKMKDKLGRPWAEIQQAYLEAYAHDPRRAEPLFAISEHWYGKEIHAVSRLFSTVAAEMPKPPTDLFLDEDVYTWKAADRAAISSFYSGHKQDGRDFAEQAVSYRPGDERMRSNRAFYSQSASELFGAEARSIDFTPEPGWNASNPSIYFDGDRLRCIVRTVNYKIVNGSYTTPPGDVVRDEGSWKGWQIIRTRNFLLDLDGDLKTTRVVEIVDKTGDDRAAYPIHGFEDARLFSWKGEWWATATVCDFTDDGRREIALLQIDDDGAVSRAEALRGPWSEHAQKNWMPLVDGAAAKFIYATSLNGDVGSMTIFDLVEAADADARPRYSIQPPVGAMYGHGRLRGGSQAVRVDGGWLFAVHDVAFPGSGRIYLHRLVFIDDKLQLVSMTDPFYFEKLGIEFCAGLAVAGDNFDKLVASYSVNDGSAKLAVFDWKLVKKTLRTDFII
jgi:FkbM family methyltransferase